MKTISWKRLALMALALGLIIPAMTGCATNKAAGSGNAALKYTCPMHPEVVQDRPGKCPKCGMDLVQKQ